MSTPSPTLFASRSGRLWLLLLLLAVFLLRLQRLDWQPLWWDEGYSVYFATESLGRMTALTAQDIHPPLYYALLHGWLRLGQSVHPLTLRFGSVVAGVLGVALFLRLTYRLFPQRQRPGWLAAVLLTVSPMHLYYSQEIRMYGLALLLAIATLLACWRLVNRMEIGQPWRTELLAYVFWATLALYTLYYLAWLLLGQLLWAGWHFRRRWSKLVPLLVAAGLILVAYLPWLIYALPKLVNYVAAKVPADADQPLALGPYLARHLIALTSGQLTWTTAWGSWSQWLVALLAGAILCWSPLSATRKRPEEMLAGKACSRSLLWFSLLTPIGAAFLLNLRLPFFPAGGERLLLFVLPPFLLLLVDGLDRLWSWQRLGAVAAAIFLLAALVGDWLFLTTPRSVAHDYRPLIRHLVQNAASEDTVLAIFPWQVGYWRTYSAVAACRSQRNACTLLRGLDEAGGPALQLLDDAAITWRADVAARLDQVLAQGTLWFPAPLSFGSTLPAAIEAHLTGVSTNVTNRWFTPTTRLSAWRALATPSLTPLAVDFGQISLAAAGVNPTSIASANQPLNIGLAWSTASAPELGATVRLVDPSGQSWASRTYAPLGSLRRSQPGNNSVDEVGLLIPAGLSPGVYEVVAGVMVSATQTLLQPGGGDRGATQLVSVGTVTVTAPTTPQPPYRLPIQHPLTPPPQLGGITLLGHTGMGAAETTLLAGEAVDLTLFWQNHHSPPSDQQIYLSLLAANGQSPAGWAGWPAGVQPISLWPAHALVQTPITFFTPATTPAGEYSIIAGLSDPASGSKSLPITLGSVTIHRRPVMLEAPQIATPLAGPVQFGAHIRLLGADQQWQGEELTLTLYWQVLQSLLPPHHIFVHADTADGQTLAQADTPPLTTTGPAPSGSWLPDEYLITHHRLMVPPNAVTHLKIGLYQPLTGARLPATIANQPAGDAAQVSVGIRD